MSPYEVLTMGRVGVDLYPLQTGVGLRDVSTFGKYLGGSATNVAVAAARLGHRSAVITRTGEDPFGEFVHQALRGYGVDDQFVTAVPGLPTPVTFCEIFPPDNFLDYDAIKAAQVYWVTVTGLSAEPSRSATLAALETRGKAGLTVLDLDYRPTFWPSREEARRWVQAALPYATVAVGNLDECDTAVGERAPARAAKALRDRGVDLAIVKQGPAGVLADDGTGITEAPPVQVPVVNGIGAGDAFGGALCHGLLAEWGTARTIRYANAAGAIVASRLACSDAMPTTDEIDDLLGSLDNAH